MQSGRIVGAGLSGLYAAYLLERKGFHGAPHAKYIAIIIKDWGHRGCSIGADRLDRVASFGGDEIRPRAIRPLNWGATIMLKPFQG